VPLGPRDVFHLVGTLLDGKYRVDRVVAEGGFGVVYAGVHVRLDLPVALKLLKPTRFFEGNRADLVANFLAEARLTAKLRHRNIAQALDTGVFYADDESEGVPWTCFEWLDGETLGDRLKKRRGSGGITPAEAWTLLSPVVDAMATAHTNGVVHRDLKPSNVMLVPTDEGVSPRIMDFGIAKLVEDPVKESTGDTSTESVFVAFSPAYAAPEQISRSRTGFWTDVHALGLIFTEVLTDARAYPVEHGTELVASVVANERPTPARHGVDVGAWEPVLKKALALDPRDRHANARELYRELESALESTNFSSTKRAIAVVQQSTSLVITGARVGWALFGLVALVVIGLLVARTGVASKPQLALRSARLDEAAPVAAAPARSEPRALTAASTSEPVPRRAREQKLTRPAAIPKPRPSSSASVLDTWP
jgi:eukaryotic-like serine/threonine-protein kinase